MALENIKGYFDLNSAGFYYIDVRAFEKVSSEQGGKEITHKISVERGDRLQHTSDEVYRYNFLSQEKKVLIRFSRGYSHYYPSPRVGIKSSYLVRKIYLFSFLPAIIHLANNRIDY